MNYLNTLIWISVIALLIPVLFIMPTSLNMRVEQVKHDFNTPGNGTPQNTSYMPPVTTPDNPILGIPYIGPILSFMAWCVNVIITVIGSILSYVWAIITWPGYFPSWMGVFLWPLNGFIIIAFVICLIKVISPAV